MSPSWIDTMLKLLLGLIEFFLAAFFLFLFLIPEIISLSMVAKEQGWPDWTPVTLALLFSVIVAAGIVAIARRLGKWRVLLDVALIAPYIAWAVLS